MDGLNRVNSDWSFSIVVEEIVVVVECKIELVVATDALTKNKVEIGFDEFY